MREQLSADVAALLDKVRSFGEAEILPIVNDYWERGEFPFELVPKLKGLNIVGDTMRGYGTTPMTAVGQGLISYELGQLDGSIGTFMGVHVGLAMQSIYILGSEAQRQRWLPAMASLDRIGAFALTEPEHGSDSIALEATAQRDGDGWVIKGRKRWRLGGSSARRSSMPSCRRSASSTTTSRRASGRRPERLDDRREGVDVRRRAAVVQPDDAVPRRPRRGRGSGRRAPRRCTGG